MNFFKKNIHHLALTAFDLLSPSVPVYAVAVPSTPSTMMLSDVLPDDPTCATSPGMLTVVEDE